MIKLTTVWTSVGLYIFSIKTTQVTKKLITQVTGVSFKTTGAHMMSIQKQKSYSKYTLVLK